MRQAAPGYMSLFLQTIPQWLMAALLYLLFRRRAYRVCPCFFAYTTFGVIADMARFITRNHPHPFYATYWISEAGYDLLGILVMYELVHTVLENLSPSRWSRLIFPAVVVASVSLSLARAHAAPPHFSSRLAFCIVVGEITVRLVQVLAVPLILIPLFGVPGNRYPLGIAAGFGLYSAVALFATVKLSNLGAGFNFEWGVILLMAYSAAELVWIWTFARPQPARLPRAYAEMNSDSDPIPPCEKSSRGLVPPAALHRQTDGPRLSA